MIGDRSTAVMAIQRWTSGSEGVPLRIWNRKTSLSAVLHICSNSALRTLDEINVLWLHLWKGHVKRTYNLWMLRRWKSRCSVISISPLDFSCVSNILSPPGISLPLCFPLSFCFFFDSPFFHSNKQKLLTNTFAWLHENLLRSTACHEKLSL